MFTVDWSDGAYTVYNLAKFRVEIVAKNVGDLVNFLNEKASLKLGDVTMIGFSLGAHIAGVAARKFVKGQIRKIVGLDPAGPLYDIKNPNDRLTSDSAKYTECVHTGFMFLGFKEPICQIDFYINSGERQPGCENLNGFLESFCSHARVLYIFQEALKNQKAFFGYRCGSLEKAIRKDCHGKPGAYLNSKENETKNLSGIYHVTTNAMKPYSRGTE